MDKALMGVQYSSHQHNSMNVIHHPWMINFIFSIIYMIYQLTPSRHFQISLTHAAINAAIFVAIPSCLLIEFWP